MKVTYNWLKDFVQIKLAPEALAEKLTMAGLEVTSLKQQEGDWVLELEITSNRPDCLSVIGIAREVAAITGKKLTSGPVSRWVSLNRRTAKQINRLTIEIEDKKDCPLYTAKIIRDVKVQASPGWLEKRLELIGCRSVNNIVDITNYILFTWGEPLHAFDWDKLSGEAIAVRRAKNGETLATIDGQTRRLHPDILVVADKKNPVAIAGVMGGKDTEVTGNTRNILLEAAVFNPLIIRRVRQSLGIQSDSSYRFERGVDLQIVEKAAGCAAGLIRECSGGKYVLAKSAGRAQIKKRSIFLRVPTVAQILGSKMSATEIKRILNSLGLKTRAQAKNSLRVDIPSYRPDLVLAIDLIEEIARIHGFASIPRTLPALKPEVNTNPKRNLVTLIKNILIGLGLNEVVTYSLTDRGSSSSFGVIDEGEPIEILNPLSREQEILRPRLMPSLAACVAYNLNQKQDYVNIFEIAGTFTYGASGPREELRLGIALCGSRSLLLEGGLIRDTAGLLHLKGIIEELFTRLGIREYRFKAQGAGEITVSVANEKIGSLTRLAQNILEGLGIKNKEVFVAELKLERLFASTDLNKKFAHLAVYPGISRDISLILKEEIPAADILSAIKEHGGLLLRQAKVVDYYKGKQIPAGFKGLTLSCLYRADERTLTEAEITPLHSRLCTFLKDRFSAQIR